MLPPNTTTGTASGSKKKVEQGRILRRAGKEGVMIYTDGVHLVGDDSRELHLFARSVGLKRRWFQKHLRHPHYDITSPGMLGRVLSRSGVVIIPTRQLLKKIIRARRNDSQPSDEK